MAYTFEYITQGTCSRLIKVTIENELIADIEFVGGCHGNLQGITALAKGMPCEKIIQLLRGIRCGHKDTSCPDQLSKALLAAKENYHL